MKQSDLERAVARATGESVSVIKAHGFSPLRLPVPDYPPPHQQCQNLPPIVRVFPRRPESLRRCA